MYLKGYFLSTEAEFMQFYGLTDIGKRRTENQDCIVMDAELGLYIVADGMGGYVGGKEASHLACQFCSEYIRDQLPQINLGKVDPVAILKKTYIKVNDFIFQKGQTEHRFHQMGTTLVTVLCVKDKVYIANIGDSRAYLYQGNKLWQISVDHSLVMEAEMKLEGNADERLQNILTRSVGHESTVVADVYSRQWQRGEMLLLCSDGLNKMVSDEEILEVLQGTSDLSKIVHTLVDTVNKLGGVDNTSVVLVRNVD